MKNKPVSKTWKINIDLKYDDCDFLKDEDLYELGDHPLYELERQGWFVVQCNDGIKTQKEMKLYEGEEKIIRHPDGEEYVYKVYKMKNQGHRENYPEIMEEWHEMHILTTMLRSAIFRNAIEEYRELISNFKYNWINAQDDDGNTFLHLAAINNADIEICKLLIDKMHAVAINVQNDNKLTAYQEAKNRGYEDICELLEDKTLKDGKK